MPMSPLIRFFFVACFCMHSMAAWAGPKLEIDKTVFNFHEIEEGPAAIAYASLKNVGDSDAVIKDVVST